MKKFGVCTILSMGLLCALFLLTPINAFADAVTLTELSGVGPWSGNAYGALIYPYATNVTSASGTVSVGLMCVSFENEVDTGEYWTATPTAIAGNLNYEGVAYIFSQVGTYGAADVQWAAWELLDGNTQFNASGADPATDGLDYVLYGYTSGGVFEPGFETSDPTDFAIIQQLVANAQNPAILSANGSIYPQYIIYVPDGQGTLGGTNDGTPQFMIGPAPAPEPGSLILLGSGMLALAALLYSRKLKALKNV